MERNQKDPFEFPILFRPLRSEFGLSQNVNGRPHIWVPKGLVVPTIEPSGAVVRLKIRRANWTPADDLPKYIAISGSMQGMNLIGDRGKNVMAVVESELDAYALHYRVADFACVVAVGSNNKNPDNFTDHLAKTKSHLLICHDNDQGGLTMLNKWCQLYPHAKAFPVPQGKDIGEAVERGQNLADWMLSALRDDLDDQNLAKTTADA